MWEIWRGIIPKHSKVVVNFFHGKPEDGPEVSKHIDDFLKNYTKIDIIVVSSTLTYRRLISWGVPESKIVKVYIGLDTKIFSYTEVQEKLRVRKALGFKSDEYVIGSFQKDGIGWGVGAEPKLIKGPDIFVETIRELSKHINISVLLTGPARGYVISSLEKLKIKLVHVNVSQYVDMPSYYKALDLYLITSREEGGPKSLLEAICSAVPVVSTPVGMAMDLVPGIEGCSLADSFEPDELVNRILKIKNSSKNYISRSSVDNIKKQVDFEIVAKEYVKRVYVKIYKEIKN
jgi:glycosyltransferase involved in cell wall biosynthesis